MAAINKNGLALEFASDKLKADKEIVIAISNNGAALEYASEELKDDKLLGTAI